MNSSSQLNYRIAPEIRYDRFYRAIESIAVQSEVRQILEIGSSSGDGSTMAFVTAMAARKDPPTLHCVEVSEPRFNALAERYRTTPGVHCHRLSTVPLDRFPSADDVAKWYTTYRPKLRRPSLETMLQWRQQDVDYLTEHNLSTWGIREIRERHDIDTFDAVLIDGSEFLGEAELAEVYGARYLLLDDILTFKNHRNHLRLMTDPRYQLLESSRWLRNGYSVFRVR